MMDQTRDEGNSLEVSHHGTRLYCFFRIDICSRDLQFIAGNKLSLYREYSLANDSLL